jgi:hypothetical protein
MNKPEIELLENEAKNKRIEALAKIYLKRVKDIGIPERYWRIKQDAFNDILVKEYHKDTKQFTDYIYDKIEDICDMPFILIDGGNIESRQLAGFAMLFRAIVYDHFGTYKTAHELMNKLSSFQPLEDLSRNEFAESLKEQDILFISEFRQNLFKTRADVGGFLDEILSERANNNRATIISFTNPLTGDISGVFNPSGVLLNDNCGIYMSRLLTKLYSSSYVDEKGKLQMHKDNPNPYKDVLRIRVRVTDE